VTETAVTAGAAPFTEQRRQARRRAAWRRRRLVLFLMSPWIVGFGVFFGYPLVMSVYLSFTHYDLLSSPKWIGWANYHYLFTEDPQVGPAVRNTLWLIAIMVPLQVLFAFGVAMMVARARRGVGFFRTVFYLPALAPPVAATMAFVYLLNPATGPVNVILGHLGISGPLWFQSAGWSKPSLTLLGIWGVGNLMIIFLAAILDAPDNRVQAFLGPGHVCTVVGYAEYEPLVLRYRVPIVVTGFEPVDMLEGILMTVEQLEAGEARLENQYRRVVTREGNRASVALIHEIFEVCDRKWRGVGAIPESGWRLREAYRDFDAERRFDVKTIETSESSVCISGEILRGLKKPHDCPAFGRDCTPDTPLGATMVSSEGACAAYFHYGRMAQPVITP